MMRVLAALSGLVNVAGAAAPAAHSAYVILLLRGTVGGQPFLMSDGVCVGCGARPEQDGIDAMYFVAQENYSVEFLELGYPVRLLQYGINQDSGGPGRQRGGCGLAREYEVLADPAVLAMRIDGVTHPPWGVAVDMSGTFTDITVQDAAGRVLRAKTPSTPHDLSGAFLTGVGLALRGVAVTASIDVLPEVREHERSLATVLNARVAAPLGLSMPDAARGILEIAGSAMIGAVRVVSVERGHDPRRFAMAAFGGAGPQMPTPGIASNARPSPTRLPPCAANSGANRGSPSLPAQPTCGNYAQPCAAL